nr:Ldh family oxidoreductase [Hyphomicrobiales bacterium]
APWGGRKALFGTNPLAFSCPVASGYPVIVDVSLSKVARGKLMAAAQKGEPVPEGWALDSDGRPTSDPKAGLAGTMIPLGDAKGTALALMVELLCAGLAGANYAYEASSFLDADGPPPNTGQMLLAIDPEAFGSGAATARFADMIAMIEADDGARVPGWRRQELRTKLLQEGLRIDASLIEDIQALSGS